MEAVAKRVGALGRDRLIRRVLCATGDEHGEFRYFYGNVNNRQTD
jgi:hypothetical protein